MPRRNKVKQLRQSQKLSQEKLAGLINVSSSTVSGWETGHKNINPEEERKLVAFFGLGDAESLYREG